MSQESGDQKAPVTSVSDRVRTKLLWLALFVCWAVSVFTVVEELCLATACRDTASFTFFGVSMGWFGIAFFSAILAVFWLRKKTPLMEWSLVALVSVGVGAELRLLWIQKYIIGGWCPLCVTICCSLFIAATLLVIEKKRAVQSGDRLKRGEGMFGWLSFAAVMAAIGLAVALVGIKALT